MWRTQTLRRCPFLEPNRQSAGLLACAGASSQPASLSQPAARPHVRRRRRPSHPIPPPSRPATSTAHAQSLRGARCADNFLCPEDPCPARLAARLSTPHALVSSSSCLGPPPSAPTSSSSNGWLRISLAHSLLGHGRVGVRGVEGGGRGADLVEGTDAASLTLGSAGSRRRPSGRRLGRLDEALARASSFSGTRCQTPTPTDPSGRAKRLGCFFWCSSAATVNLFGPASADHALPPAASATA